MQRASTVAIWRCGVVVLALISATQLAIEAFNAPRVLSLGVLSEPLFKGHFLVERGPTRFVVDAISPRSPLNGAGVTVGDILQWDEPIGRWYNVAAGEHDALTVLRGDAVRRIELTMPAALVLPRHQVANYLLDMVERVAALLIGVMIGWRRADLVCFRGFAAAALLSSVPFPYSAPLGAHIEWLDFIGSSARDLAIAALVFFAINYPDDKPSGWRAILKRYYPWFFGLVVVVEVGYYARLYAGFYEPATRLFFRATSIGLPVLFLVTVILAWRQARGEPRLRFQWILATLGTVAGSVLIDTLNALAGAPVAVEDMALIVTVAQLAALAGLVYAILRHRIFDFGLAVNRTLVFAIVGAILLGAFQVVHAIIGEFLHFDDKNKTILLSAILAGTVYLSFNQLKKVVEKVVDRIFFSSWAMREQGLKRFVREAKHMTDANALTASLHTALERFTQGAASALFRRDASGAYVRTGGTLAAVPDRVDANDGAILAMLAQGEIIHLRDASSSLKAALALPMAHRNELLGFILLAPKPGGEPYRPDQIDALAIAAHEIGLDFYALRIEQLEDQLAIEHRTSETLRAQLETAMEVAKGRPAPSAS